MATLGETSQQTVSPNGTTFDQGVNDVIAQEPGLQQDLSQGNSFYDMSAATRQLVAENAASAAGDPNMINSDAAQQFINGSAQTQPSATGSNPYPSGTGGTPSGTTGGATTSPATSADGSSSDLNSLIEDRYGSLLSPGLTEQQILDQENAKIQAQVDAINNLYTYKLQDEEKNGLNRLGRGRSLNAISGNAWNPFGEARTQDIERQNKQIVDQINAEKAAELANLYAQARGETTRRVEHQADQLSANTNAYIDHMVQSYGLSQQEADSLRNDAARVAALTGYYNGNATMDKQNQDFAQNQTLQQFLYQKEQDALQNQRANQQIDMQMEELRRSGYQTAEMPDGTVGYWDYSSGAPKFVSVGNYAKISSSGGGGSSGGSQYGYDPSLESAAINAYWDATGQWPSDKQESQNVVDRYAASITTVPNDGTYGPVEPYANDPFAAGRAQQYQYKSTGTSSGGGPLQFSTDPSHQ